MATRVIAVPDSNGLIRVACGSDVIEIQVVTAAAAGPGGGAIVGGGTAPPVRPGNPFKDPFAAFVHDLHDNAPGGPDTILRVPRGPDGKIDVNRLLAEAHQQVSDPGRPDPRAVVITAEEANLHELHQLGEQIAETMPDLLVGVRFDDVPDR